MKKVPQLRYNHEVELTLEEQALVIELYVTKRWHIKDVIKELMSSTGKQHKVVYPKVSDFLRSKRLFRHGGKKFGDTHWKWLERECTTCHRSYTPTSSSQRYCVACKGNKASLVMNYGITIEDYESLLARQKMKCGVCQRDLSELSTRQVHVDHCHRTGAVRGIICHLCNHRLCVLDDEAWVTAARQYLAQPSILPKFACRTLRKVQR